MTPTHSRVLAIDWSGAKHRGGADRIWLAEVRDGALVRLESGRSRTEVVDHLIDEAEGSGEMIVGLDFAFSFPAWFLEREGVSRGREVWRRTAERGEGWLDACDDPFWGKPGQPKPELPAHFRQTEVVPHCRGPLHSRPAASALTALRALRLSFSQ